MHPILFRIPGLGYPIRTFGALVACGILFAMWLWGRFLAAYGDDPKEDPQSGWQGGLVMYGGLLGGILLGLLGARKYGLDPWNALDTALVCGFFGLVLGRVGCLMVGDDYGLPVPEAFEHSARPLVLANGGEIGAL